MTLKDAFGIEPTLEEIQAVIRTRPLISWLYLASRMNLAVTYDQLMDPAIEAKWIEALFSPDHRRRLDERRQTGPRLILHRHQLLVFLRLLLITEGLPPPPEGEDAGYGHDVGPMLLAINDRLDDAFRAAVSDPSSSRKAKRKALRDYSLLKQDLAGEEVPRYALQREFDLAVVLPAELNAPLAESLHAASTAALGLAPEEFIALSYAMLAQSYMAPESDDQAPVLYFDFSRFLGNFGIAEDRKRAFIGLVSQCLAHAQENAAKATPWEPRFVYGFSDFKKWPIIRLSESHSIVASGALLLRRMTTGFYDLLHSKVARHCGNRTAKKLEKMRGDAAELYVRHLMEQVVQHTRVSGASVAPSFKYQRVKEAGDVLLLYGRSPADGILLVIEVKHTATEEPVVSDDGPRDPFRKGSALFKALKTLGRLVTDIRGEALDHRLPEVSKFRLVVPIVAARQIPFPTDILREELNEQARNHRVPTGDGVSPVVLMTFDELELAPALEEHGLSFPNQVYKWATTATLNGLSFTNFLWQTDRARVTLATSNLERRRDTLSDRLWDILRVRSPDSPSPPGSGAGASPSP